MLSAWDRFAPLPLCAKCACVVFGVVMHVTVNRPVGVGHRLCRDGDQDDEWGEADGVAEDARDHEIVLEQSYGEDSGAGKATPIGAAKMRLGP